MIRSELLLAALLLFTNSAGVTQAQEAVTKKHVVIEYSDITGSQPMSSAPWVTHVRGFHLWQLGKPASVAVEVLAESGNPEYILGEALTDRKTFGDFAVGLPDLPAGTRRVELVVDEAHPLVSGGWMLVATNDGFTGVDGVDAFALHGPKTIDVYALDAGTEVNTENKSDVLGGLGRVPENGVVHPHEGIRGDVDIPRTFGFDPAKPVGRVTIKPVAAGTD